MSRHYYMQDQVHDRVHAITGGVDFRRLGRAAALPLFATVTALVTLLNLMN